MSTTYKTTRRDMGGGSAPSVTAAAAGDTIVIVAGKRHKPVAAMIPFALAESLGVVTREQVENCPRFEPSTEE